MRTGADPEGVVGVQREPVQIRNKWVECSENRCRSGRSGWSDMRPGADSEGVNRVQREPVQIPKQWIQCNENRWNSQQAWRLAESYLPKTYQATGPSFSLPGMPGTSRILPRNTRITHEEQYWRVGVGKGLNCEPPTALPRTGSAIQFRRSGRERNNAPSLYF
ncbi:hypothetical protein NDU88_010124 [Pleurodeles waltl]|uniref:Uncharacterized protein n=1 Tax=Pleurodeles waltl TaxID=8319 RepID=A0AAV7PUC3_PLEWA|nr:hypothetical protein NDU88_010124 [Pleurodeles waltl]